jgi:hypothetical protein
MSKSAEIHPDWLWRHLNSQKIIIYKTGGAVLIQFQPLVPSPG